MDLSAIFNAISNIFGYQLEKQKNIVNAEVIDDKNKLELAKYHAQKAFDILVKNNFAISPKNVMFRYHYKKFLKYS